MTKPGKAPSHKELTKALFKDKAYQKKIMGGVKRLRVITQLVELREKLGLTQAELARRIGASQPFVAKIENDEASNLSLETLVKMAEALNAELAIQIHPSEKAA